MVDVKKLEKDLEISKRRLEKINTIAEIAIPIFTIAMTIFCVLMVN